MVNGQLVENYDRAAVREWLSYKFWTPESFAGNHGISIRQLRNLMTQGLPFHGRPHRGVPGSGVRLGVAAVQWMREYRRVTAEGHFRGTRCLMALDEIEGRHFDDQLAYAKLYGGPTPHDEWLESREGSAERRSWAIKFREIKTRT